LAPWRSDIERVYFFREAKKEGKVGKARDGGKEKDQGIAKKSLGNAKFSEHV